MMLNEATRQYIREHEQADCSLLALRGRAPEGVDLALALSQIQGRQTALRKLPTWAATEGLVFPPHLSMEQCSSEATAQYKARLLCRLAPTSLTDLTGGFGVDFATMARALRAQQPAARLTYVERDDHLSRLARHNLPLLGLAEARVEQAEAEAYLARTAPAADAAGAAIFLDPARRDAHGGRTYGMADCTPNVLPLLPLLLERARWVVLKLSPMLDWHRAVADLQQAGHSAGAVVSEVHAVSTGGECKELLLVVTRRDMLPTADEAAATLPEQGSRPALHCASDHHHFACQPLPEGQGAPPVAPPAAVLAAQHIWVPNAAVMKMGCFAQLCSRFDLAAVGPNSHLFVGSGTHPTALAAPGQPEADAFPGKCFALEAAATLNKRELGPFLSGLTHANLATRNFPLSPDELRRRLKLRDGGTTYLFATTLADRRHVLLRCHKA